MHMSSSPSSASNLEWVIRNFGPWREGDLPDHARAMEEAFAAAAQPQHRPQPVYLPFLYGSPHGDAMPATLTGLRGWHTRGDVLHAVLKGVVFNHRTHVDALREQFDLSSGARVCGGGARSPKWTQLLADSLNVPVEVTDVDQAGARGAALLAGVGTGHYRDLNHAIAQTVRVVRRHEPHAPTARVLEVEYARYLDLVHALMPLFNDDPAATRHYLKEPLCH